MQKSFSDLEYAAKKKQTRGDRLGYGDAYRNEPIGGFVYEKSEFWGLGETYYQAGLRVDATKATGAISYWGEPLGSDVAGLAVYSPANLAQPSYRSVSYGIGAPVWVGRPTGAVEQYSGATRSIIRGQGSC